MLDPSGFHGRTLTFRSNMPTHKYSQSGHDKQELWGRVARDLPVQAQVLGLEQGLESAVWQRLLQGRLGELAQVLVQVQGCSG